MSTEKSKKLSGTPADDIEVGDTQPIAENDPTVMTLVHGQWMARIAPPIAPVTDGMNEAGDQQSVLVALEANNTIKYRTCTWQKVARPKAKFVSCSRKSR